MDIFGGIIFVIVFLMGVFMKIFKFDLSKCWMFVFILFFLFVPLSFFSDSFKWTIVFLAVSVLVSYKINIPKFPIVLFAVAFLLRVVIVLILQTPVKSDFGAVLTASQGILNNDLSFVDMPYFEYWPYQVGFAFFQSLLLRIWNSVIFLKLFNCLLGAGTALIVYFIAKEFVDEKAARASAVFYCFLPFPLTYVTILSNQFSASFLIYLGIYIFISKKIKLKSLYKCIVFGVLLALANVLRPESIIPLFATVLYLLLTVNKANYKEHLINLGVLVAVYYGLFSLISLGFKLSGLAPQGLINGDPLWKFVLGFNSESKGMWNAADSKYMGDMEASLAIIKERLMKSIPEWLELFDDKISVFWSYSPLFWSFGYCLQSGLNVFGKTFRIIDDYEILSEMNKWLVLVVYLLLVFGIYKCIRKKDFDRRIILIINQVFVTFGVYLLIEVQQRYVYCVQISVFILAALGIYEISKLFKKLKQLKSEDSKEKVNV